jgi:putative aldouronate transport system substrate-binding protein
MKARKPMRILAAVLSLGVLLTGCSFGKEPDKSTQSAASGGTAPVKLTFFDLNAKDTTLSDPVAKEIVKKSGVTLELEQPTGDPNEKLNLMLGGNNYPDIVDMSLSTGIIEKYVNANALVPLDDLIDQYGPNIKKMYGDNLNKARSSDGKLYYLSNWYGEDETDVVSGFLMRHDILKELAGDKADNAKPFTQEEFINLLKDYKAKYPNGTPFTLRNDSSNEFLGHLKGMFGMKTYYNDNGTLSYDVRDPKYLTMLKFINELYRDGLLEKEWVVNKTTLWTQKLSSGNVFASLGAYWDPVDANTSLASTKGQDSVFIGYNVVGDGIQPQDVTYGGMSSMGWDGIGITKNCKDPVAAIKFLDFLASEDGQYLMMWGVQGTDYTVENGKHVPNQDVLKQLQSDPNAAIKSTGIGKYTWCIKNGAGSDGTFYDMVDSYQDDPVKEASTKNLTGSYWDTAEYSSLAPQGSTPEGLKAQKLTDIETKAIPKIVDASSEAEMEQQYHQMISDMDAAGMKDVEKVINDNYQARMKLWNTK